MPTVHHSFIQFPCNLRPSPCPLLRCHFQRRLSNRGALPVRPNNALLTSCFKRNQDVGVVVSPPFEFAFHDASNKHLLLENSTRSALPILLYVSGLGAEPMPECQALTLRSNYVVVSLGLCTDEDSDWPTLLRAALVKISVLRKNSSSPLTLVAESFGTVFALRLVAVSPRDMFERQVLINPATAVNQDSILLRVCSLLSLLRLDPTQRILYKIAAAVFYRFILTNPNQVAPSSIPDGPEFLQSVDIDKVPLSSMLHRIDLLIKDISFNDEFLRDNINLPTILVASGRDKLLQSSREVERLSGVLPNVQRKIILPNSAHAALFELQVNLMKILHYSDDSLPSNSGGYVLQSQWQQARYQAATDLGKALYEPWRQLTRPKVFGRENVTEALRQSVQTANFREGGRAVVFVGNHGCHGILDTSLLFLELYNTLGNRRLRPLADRTHFDQYGTVSGGRWTHFVEDLGAVQASPRNFCELLSKGDCILLFPGGGREVCRRRGEQNTIHWDSQSDFVRIAAKYNAIIVPFSAVGADDAVDILIDGQELQRIPIIGPRIRKLMQDYDLSPENLAPLTSPPRLNRFYFNFHKPVDTAPLNSKDKSGCQQEFEKTKHTVIIGIQDLLNYRETDPLKTFRSRVDQARNKRTKNVLKSVVDALSFPIGI